MSDIDITIKSATKRAEGDGRMDDVKLLKELYEAAKKVGYSEALGLARGAKNEEERNFFAYVADMCIQREQRKAIQRNVF